jgi:hypothetical protein
MKNYSEKNIVKYFVENKKKIHKSYKTPRSKTVFKSRKISSIKECNNIILKPAELCPGNMKARKSDSQTLKHESSVKEETKIIKSSDPKKIPVLNDKVVKQDIKQEVLDIKEGKNNIHQDLESSLGLDDLSDDIELGRKMRTLLDTEITLGSSMLNAFEGSSDEQTIDIELPSESKRTIHKSKTKIENTTEIPSENMSSTNDLPKISKDKKLSKRNTSNRTKSKTNSKYKKFSLVENVPVYEYKRTDTTTRKVLSESKPSKNAPGFSKYKKTSKTSNVKIKEEEKYTEQVDIKSSESSSEEEIIIHSKQQIKQEKGN